MKVLPFRGQEGQITTLVKPPRGRIFESENQIESGRLPFGSAALSTELLRPKERGPDLNRRPTVEEVTSSLRIALG